MQAAVSFPTRGRAIATDPLSLLLGEKEGPTPQAWEDEGSRFVN